MNEGVSELDVSFRVPVMPKSQCQAWISEVGVWFEKPTLKSSQNTADSGNCAATKSQSATFKIKSLRWVLMILPFRHSFMQTVITKDPAPGAIPEMIPVVGLMVTPEPNGEEAP